MSHQNPFIFTYHEVGFGSRRIMNIQVFLIIDCQINILPSEVLEDKPTT